MMRRMGWLLLGALMACEPGASEEGSRVEIAQAPEPLAGKADSGESMWILDGEDMCAFFGLYDDAKCHDFCPEPDLACTPGGMVLPEAEPLPCAWEIPYCDEGERGIDTDRNGCTDLCVMEFVGCAAESDCLAGDYCSRPLGDCDGAVGTCLPKPSCSIGDISTWTPELVCGCDGVTYGMPCDAYSLGVNLASEGFCPDLL